MTKLGITLATVLSAAAALASSALANETYRTDWGGIGFAMSDRNIQASGSALGLTVDPTGQVVAALGEAYPGVFAYRFTPGGAQTARFKVDRGARAIAVGPTGRIFTAGKKGTVTRWSPGGAREAGFAASGPVAALAVDRDGNVYAASGNGVQRYSADGVPGTGYGFSTQVGTAAGVTVAANGHVLIADPQMQRVEEFDASGAFVRAIGGPDAGDGGLVAPTLVGVDRAGHVVVGDPGGESIMPPPNIRRYRADGHYEGPVDGGMSIDFDTYGEPFLMAADPQGSVYFADNPDFVKIPAALVPAPRMLFDDDQVIGGGQYTALPVSIGRRIQVPTRIFPSLATGVEERAIVGRGLTLAGGTPDVRPGDVPAGDQKLDLTWPIEPTIPGRHVVQFNLTGTDPDGDPTSVSRLIAIYAIDGPHMRIPGALWLPKARTIFLAVKLDLGGLKIAPGEEDVLEQISYGNLSTSLRAGGHKLQDGNYELGEAASGACIPFSVPKGIRGRRRFKARAAFGGVPNLDRAHLTRTIKPRVHVKRKGLLADCLLTSGLAGGPTR
ncbi:MAG: hypothetical protein QOG63_2210 [Thermoleophilaceae bacterium]|nr:hypothetical protein [Thermoleophilaceae bacterium]